MPTRPKSAAFTLLELLVVIGIIVILAVAAIPAVNSLAKSNGRKAALGNLLGTLEQARVEAIKTGQPTYLVFAILNNNTAIDQNYAYRAYAIFEDDPANPSTPKQVSNWKTMPTGVALRKDSLDALSTAAFQFAALNKSVQMPYLKFAADGGVDPASTPAAAGPIQFGIFEGSVTASGNHFTGHSTAAETLQVNRLTGRPNLL